MGILGSVARSVPGKGCECDCCERDLPKADSEKERAKIGAMEHLFGSVGHAIDQTLQLISSSAKPTSQPTEKTN